MKKLLCEECGTELIEDDCLEEELNPDTNWACQYKIWHCPACNIEYSGEITYSVTIKSVEIKRD